MNYLKFFITLLLVCPAFIPAFSADENERNGYVRVDYSYSMPFLFFTDTDRWSYDLYLNPENNSSLGITFNYNGFFLGLSTNTLFGGGDALSDIFFTWFGEKIGIEFYYQKYSDYYIANDNNNKKYPGPNEYPDMNVMNNGVNFYYFFRNNTYRNIFKQDEELLKKGWSPFLKVSMGRFSIDNDESIIPAADRPQFDPDAASFNRYHSWQAVFSAGISGTYSYDYFYISGLVSIGGGGEYYRYSSPGSSYNTDKNLLYDLDLQLVYGIVTSEFFVGVINSNENQMGRIKNLSIQVDNFQASLFAGMFF